MDANSKQTGGMGLTRRKLLKYGLRGGLTAALAPSLWLTGCGEKHLRGQRPNIILITVDALRADHLSCYGYPKNTSPNIDLFAQDAMLFENCFSQAPATRPSFASILTGFLPHETRVLDKLFLPAGVETLAEILQQAEYKTVAVISNYVLQKGRGYEQGFMIYDDTMNEQELVRKQPERIAEHTTNRAIELLKQFHKDQTFMWIHYQDPHGPYTPPARSAKLFWNPDREPRSLRLNTSLSGRGGIPSYQSLAANSDFHYYVSQYDGEIRYQDEHFKGLIDALKQLDLYDSSLIVFSSDHGEGMGEHNYYFAHGENLYNSLTHVPLIIKYGGQLSGRRTDYVQHLDIVPTILRVVGKRVNSRFRGRDLRRQHETAREIFSEMKTRLVADGVKFSIILAGLKLIYTLLSARYQLFNLKTDFHEEHDLIEDPRYQEQANDLKVRLHRIHREDFLKVRTLRKPPKLSDEEIERLKSLGYIR